MSPKFILLDIDTQRDFLDRSGAFPILDRQSLLNNLRKVFVLARSYHVPIISSLDTHRPDDWFRGLPKHCIEGSSGYKKVALTIMRNHTVIDANNTLDLPPDLLSNYRQILLRKRTPDFLENPKADRLLSHLSPELFILFGVGMELTIRSLALALIARGKQVACIPEACGYWNETDADLAQRLIAAKSGLQLSIPDLKTRLAEAAKRRVKPTFSKRNLPDKHSTKPPQSLAG